MSHSYSPLRYPGGKVKLYNYVRDLLKENNLLGETYIEPFAGGAGLALKLLICGDVKRIVINDLDPAIYAFWYSILNYTEEFCSLIEKTPITVSEWHKQKSIYITQDTEDKLTLGFATFFLNRTNISGVIKGGVIGGQNQTGKYKINARFNKKSLIERIKLIATFKKNIIILNLDAKELLSAQNLSKYYKVFINIDPPYVQKGSQLYQNSFSHEDHCELAKVIKQCNRKWIVTYDICPLIEKLYSDYYGSYLELNYSVHRNKKANEYIFFSKKTTIPSVINIFNSSSYDVG